MGETQGLRSTGSPEVPTAILWATAARRLTLLSRPWYTRVWILSGFARGPREQATLNSGPLSRDPRGGGLVVLRYVSGGGGLHGSEDAGSGGTA